ncbi:DUF1272 domain-containing protein [Paenibacillus mucilaginosus]|uniref:RING-type domain-containing protein n=2 Tax=Paenibacillus mucilaginosus TaxID=61624 RepID=H6NAD1_9BACL|nr:DUF1272 domain-containing protein [Paenibacillus mucilaginosus]AEI40776.1 hypothetical protein KNP414_02215 [Paenibacillus mucilaginosus KNP414]AFC29377.1 hypothetical protein PM3016_2491 [Paenibacillus mucilaginosus 3016]MCG7211747.1 DUF1272 domain-containing protein [Paenibacillus mucilaginosus]WDM31218.1 DUF1272 domain-containing protein [Paenibacillus mucilaginosus]WFA22563.1 DUF1272 domain-containing protein [Paenibacillus mucilaginosus]
MGLEMRDRCETCTKALDRTSTAYICTHECTFCPECTEAVHHVCPNCGGELVKRPRSGPAVTSCPFRSQSVHSAAGHAGYRIPD